MVHIYTERTNNLDIKIPQHQSDYKKGSYTYKRRPFILEFYQEFNDVLQAIYFKKKIKGWSSAKISALINGDFDMFKYCQNVEMQLILNIKNTKSFDCAQDDNVETLINLNII